MLGRTTPKQASDSSAAARCWSPRTPDRLWYTLEHCHRRYYRRARASVPVLLKESNSGPAAAPLAGRATPSESVGGWRWRGRQAGGRYGFILALTRPKNGRPCFLIRCPARNKNWSRSASRPPLAPAPPPSTTHHHPPTPTVLQP